MYKLNELRYIKKFIRREKLSFVIYVLLSFFIILGKLSWVIFIWTRLNNMDKVQYYIVAADIGVPLILMIVVFTSLLYQLRFYHNFEFNKNVKNMTFFFILEIGLSLIILIGNY